MLQGHQCEFTLLLCASVRACADWGSADSAAAEADPSEHMSVLDHVWLLCVCPGHACPEDAQGLVLLQVGKAFNTAMALTLVLNESVQLAPEPVPVRARKDCRVKV